VTLELAVRLAGLKPAGRWVAARWNTTEVTLWAEQKSFLQGLKPISLVGSTPGLKPRPPEEKAPASESGRYNTKRGHLKVAATKAIAPRV